MMHMHRTEGQRKRKHNEADNMNSYCRGKDYYTNKVHEFEVRKRPLEALADTGLNGEYNLKELMRLVSLGAACTHSDPKLRPSTTQIVSIIDGNDKLIMGENMDSNQNWRERNACFSY